MKYYSEILKKAFDTEAACLKAEKEHTEMVAAKKATEEKLAKARKERAKEIEDALHEVYKARKHYTELLEAFCKDYGAFHFTLKDSDTPLTHYLTSLLDWF